MPQTFHFQLPFHWGKCQLMFPVWKIICHSPIKWKCKYSETHQCQSLLFPKAALHVWPTDWLNAEELYSNLTWPEHSSARSTSSGMQWGHLWLELGTGHAQQSPVQRLEGKSCSSRDTFRSEALETLWHMCTRRLIQERLQKHVCKEGNNPNVITRRIHCCTHT